MFGAGRLDNAQQFLAADLAEKVHSVHKHIDPCDVVGVTENYVNTMMKENSDDES